MMLRKFFCLMFMLLAFLVSGCGGGSGGTSAGSTATPVTTTVTGVAATGSPIVGTVYLKDSSAPSKELVIPIAADGSYSFNVTNLTKPFLLKAVGTVNGANTTLYSVSAGPGIANINPFTNIAAMSAAAGNDLATVYANATLAALQQVNAAFSQAMTDLMSQLAPLLAAYQVQNVNPATAAYSANHQGLDALFDAVVVTTTGGQATISNKATSAPIYVSQVSALGSGTLTSANIPGSTSSVSSSTLAALQSGLYCVMGYTPLDTSVYSNSTEKVALNAAETAMTVAYQASFSKTSNSWVDTTASTVTPDPNDYVYELASGTWQQVTNYRASSHPVQVGPDGSVVLVDPTDGSRAQITVTTSDVSGQSLQSALGDSYIWQGLIAGSLASSATSKLPSGALRYDITWSQLSDNYLLLPGSVNDASGVVTSLSQISAAFSDQSGYHFALDSDDTSSFYFVTFTNSSTVNIYRQSLNLNSQPQLIGTGAYGPANAVTGPTVMEISIPATLRTTYHLSDNPIFGVVNGAVLQGYHASAGTVSYTNSVPGYVNLTAETYIQSLFQSGAAKAAVVKRTFSVAGVKPTFKRW